MGSGRVLSRPNHGRFFRVVGAFLFGAPFATNPCVPPPNARRSLLLAPRNATLPTEAKSVPTPIAKLQVGVAPLMPRLALSETELT